MKDTAKNFCATEDIIQNAKTDCDQGASVSFPLTPKFTL